MYSTYTCFAIVAFKNALFIFARIAEWTIFTFVRIAEQKANWFSIACRNAVAEHGATETLCGALTVVFHWNLSDNMI